MPGDLLNTKEVAEHLGINEKQVYALIKAKRIPATRITGKWMFPRKLLHPVAVRRRRGRARDRRAARAGSPAPGRVRVRVRQDHLGPRSGRARRVFDPNRDVSGDFRRRYTLGAYYDHVPLNARVILNYELDDSTTRQDDVLLVQTQVVF